MNLFTIIIVIESSTQSILLILVPSYMVSELLDRYQTIRQLRLLPLFIGVALVILPETHLETLLQWEG
jgi:predicted tellurium resistance membrane protein TerC